MTDEPATAVAAPSSASGESRASGDANGQGRGGIIARGGQEAGKAISAALTQLGFAPRTIDFRPLPFAGTWGLATSVAFAVANEAVTAELESTGKLEGLAKKEAKA